MAEEVFCMDVREFVDGRAADIWSLGITLFTMLGMSQTPARKARNTPIPCQLRHGGGFLCSTHPCAQSFSHCLHLPALSPTLDGQ
jgi:hypothetical protein